MIYSFIYLIIFIIKTSPCFRVHNYKVLRFYVVLKLRVFFCRLPMNCLQCLKLKVKWRYVCQVVLNFRALFLIDYNEFFLGKCKYFSLENKNVRSTMYLRFEIWVWESIIFVWCPLFKFRVKTRIHACQQLLNGLLW